MGTPKDKALPLKYEQKVTLVRLIKQSEAIPDKKTNRTSVDKILFAKL